MDLLNKVNVSQEVGGTNGIKDVPIYVTKKEVGETSGTKYVPICVTKKEVVKNDSKEKHIIKNQLKKSKQRK